MKPFNVYKQMINIIITNKIIKKLLVLNSNIWNHLTLSLKISFASFFKNNITYKLYS